MKNNKNSILELPKVGDKLYVVRENLYYEKGNPAPLLEYVIYAAYVVKYIKGKYTEIEMKIDAPISNRLEWRRISELNKQYVFHSIKDAAIFAKQLTDRYENTSLFAITNTPPLRRSWQRYL